MQLSEYPNTPQDIKIKKITKIFSLFAIGA